MAAVTVAPRRGAEKLSALLASPEVAVLVADLESTRWTGRPGYPIRAMVGMTLVKSFYVLPTWTRTVALVTEHGALRKAIGCPDAADVPSIYACYRFTAKLRANGPNARLLHHRRPGLAQGRAAWLRRHHRHRRVRPPRLRQRPEVRVQPRPGADAVLRPRCILGPQEQHRHEKGRRLLRVQAPRRGRRSDRPSRVVDDAHSERAEVPVVADLLDISPGTASAPRSALPTKAMTWPLSTTVASFGAFAPSPLCGRRRS